jgi:hypothetical protein
LAGGELGRPGLPGRWPQQQQKHRPDYPPCQPRREGYAWHIEAERASGLDHQTCGK